MDSKQACGLERLMNLLTSEWLSRLSVYLLNCDWFIQ